MVKVVWFCKAVVEGSICIAESAARADSSAAVGSELGFQDQFSMVGRGRGCRGMVVVLEAVVSKVFNCDNVSYQLAVLSKVVQVEKSPQR
jgi:hypothetical protein